MSQNCEGEKVQNNKAAVPLTVEGWTMQDCITMQERMNRIYREWKNIKKVSVL